MWARLTALSGSSMPNSHERRLALRYLATMLGRLNRKRAQAASLVEWVADNAAPFATGARSVERIATAASKAMDSSANWRALQSVVDKTRRAASDATPDLMGRRLCRLADAVGLSPLDIDLLEVLLRYATQPVIESLIDAAFLHVGGSRMPMNVRSGALSCVLGKSVKAVGDRFAEDAPLIRTGLVSIDQDQDVQAIGRLRRLDSPDPEEVDVRQFLLGEGRVSELEWSDFGHLGQSREDVARLVRGAVDRGARGVNILVYGPPGTGKTEFCRVLARRAGLDLFGVGEADDNGNEPSRQERLAELRLAQCLLGEDSGGVLLFDEMEDLLSGSTFSWSPFEGLLGGGRRRSSSKVFMNRLLEETPAPTFWTTNVAEDIDPAILRRMTFALEMRQPSTQVRARVWQRQLSSHGIEATPARPWRWPGSSMPRRAWRPAPRQQPRWPTATSSWCAEACEACLACSVASAPSAASPPNSTRRSSRPRSTSPTSQRVWPTAATGASRCACRGLPARARAPTPATSPSASAWRSCNGGRRTCLACTLARPRRTSPGRSPRRARKRHFWCSTKQIRCWRIAGERSGTGRSAR